MIVTALIRRAASSDTRRSSDFRLMPDGISERNVDTITSAGQIRPYEEVLAEGIPRGPGPRVRILLCSSHQIGFCSYGSQGGSAAIQRGPTASLGALSTGTCHALEPGERSSRTRGCITAKTPCRGGAVSQTRFSAGISHSDEFSASKSLSGAGSEVTKRKLMLRLGLGTRLSLEQRDCRLGGDTPLEGAVEAEAGSPARDRESFPRRRASSRKCWPRMI